MMDERGIAFDAVERRDTDGPMPPEAGADAAPGEVGVAEAEEAATAFWLCLTWLGL